MKTYEQGKAELDAELKRLNKAIKDAKQKITYDFHCPQCNKTKKFRVHCGNTGRGGKKYCSHNCRNLSYQRRKQAQKLKKLGLADEKIYQLQLQIDELKK
jgi:predicted nucleic acid-binding Zn ribbon protein